MVASHLSAAAQDTLTTAHGLRGGDRVVRQVIANILPGRGGEHVVWDFRGAQVLGEEEVVYEGDSLVTGTSRKNIHKYLVNGDGTWLTGWENILERMDYRKPLRLARYPMAYGDSLSCTFTGRGRYCDLYDIDVCGTHFAEVDACGMMVVGDDDTLRHVLRLHSVRLQSMAIDTPPEQLDSALALRQQVEERFAWYARGYRYPIMELFSRASYYKLALVSTYQKAYLCLPDVQRLAFSDSLNESIAQQDSIDALQPRMDTFHYTISLSGSEVLIDFDLDCQSQLTFILSDIRGMLYRKKAFWQQEGTGYQARIDCYGLPSGEYILYMNANGQIYSEKIRLQH